MSTVDDTIEADKKLFDNAIKTLEEYTEKVKRISKEYYLKKREAERKKIEEVLPAGIKGSANDSTIMDWKKSLRPFC